MFSWFRKKSGISMLEPVPIIQLVEKKERESLDFWFDITSDIEAFISETKNQKPEFMLPLFYAYRYAMAVRFISGKINEEDYGLLQDIFLPAWKPIREILMPTGKDNQAQTDFQDKSAAHAIDFIRSYGFIGSNRVAEFAVIIAEEHISVFDALFNSLVDELGLDKKDDCLAICQTQVTSQFCIKFISLLTWDSIEDDVQSAVERVGDFYRSKLFLDRLDMNHKENYMKSDGIHVISNYSKTQYSIGLDELSSFIPRKGFDNGHVWSEIREDTEYLVFADDFFEEESIPIALKVGICCVYKMSMAGLFLEGTVDFPEYEKSGKFFDRICNDLKLLVEKDNINQEDWLGLIEDSLDQSVYMIGSYYTVISKATIKSMMAMADKNIRFSHCIWFVVRENRPNLSKLEAAEICAAILDPNYYLEFFRSKVWNEYHDDDQATIIKVGNFFYR